MMLRIGTCVKGENLFSELPFVMDHGFETVEIYFDQGLQDLDLVELSDRAKEISHDRIVFSGIGVYVNPLQNEEKRHEVEKCIDCAKLFGADVVSTFAGRWRAFLSLLLLTSFKKYLEN